MASTHPEAVGAALSRLLREKREALGLSMNQLAVRAGLSHSMVSRVEHGLRKPTLDTLLRMAKAMDIELWPLVKDAEKAK